MQKWEFSCGMAISVMVAALFLVLFAINIPVSTPSWADWAGWVQAIGSIAAIVSAFQLGSIQAATARRDDLHREDRERTRKEQGYRSVVQHLVNEMASIATFVGNRDPDTLSRSWESFLKPAAMAAIAAFDSLPIYDLGSSERISAAFALREEAQDFFGEITRTLADKDRRGAYKELESGLADRHKNLKDLKDMFDAAYSS
ncbi:hypothetical protein IB257_30070 [Achromobacter sp. ACM03]|uniref:hypothetical protein n=1 Tax=Achromobacter sp. ACM03 TaxID=2769300 RepID=UPI0017847D16|nr:hypothetical protein [Achromobacter sp. ACM03]MBD9434205.1 hypothetical protein [Achromobacter sp. ACM03]